MTREEAVNWLINVISDIGKIEHQDLWHYEQALSEIRELLEAQPEVLACGEGELSAQPEQRWIPVTERLPEDEYVLISKKPTKLSGYKWSVTIAIRMADLRSGKIQWRDTGFGVIQDDKVLAWMPLPEPYREDGEAE